MAPRTLPGCLLFAGLALSALVACKEDKPRAAAVGPLEQRCAKLASACGDKDKHVGKIMSECSVAAQAHVDKGCADTAKTLYECYEKQLCGKSDRVWTLEDLPKLATRKGTCVAEQKASDACIGK